MKRILLLLVIGLSLSIHTLFAQSPSIQWQKTLGGSEGDMAYNIQQTTDGGYVFVGNTLSNNGDVAGNHGGGDIWVVKLSNTGVIQWQKTLGGTNYDFCLNITQTSDDGFIIAAGTDSNDGDVTGNHGDRDIWVVKLSNSGVIQWQKCYGGTEQEGAGSIKQTIDGGYIVSGQTNSNNGDVVGNYHFSDLWIVKLSNSGIIEWQKCYGGTASEYPGSIQQTNDGGYIINGVTESNDGDVEGNHGDADIWVLKISSTGELLWQKVLGGTLLDYAFSIQQTTDGGYIVVGETNSNDGDVTGNHGNNDIWVVKLTNIGTIQWQKTLGGSGGEGSGYNMQTESINGGYIIAGQTNSNDGDVTGNHGGFDIWVVKLSNSGVIQWQKCYGGTSDEMAFSMKNTTDGGNIVAGLTMSNDVYGDAWIVKLSPESLSTFTFDSSIVSIYPNPAKDHVTIDCDNLANVVGWNIKITNMLGQEVFNKPMNAQQYVVPLNSWTGQGMYFVKIINAQNEVVNIKKIILQ